MPLLRSKNTFSVGLKVLDDQRKSILAHLNVLHAAGMIGGIQFGAFDQLSKIIRFSTGLFAAEEALMASTNYPGLAAQRATHQELSVILSNLMDRHQEGDCAPYFQLLRLVVNRFRYHLIQDDREFASWLNTHGANFGPQVSDALHSRPSNS